MKKKKWQQLETKYINTRTHKKQNKKTLQQNKTKTL